MALMLDYPCSSQKTGEQLLTMFKQLILVGHGLVPSKDWYAQGHRQGVRQHMLSSVGTP